MRQQVFVDVSQFVGDPVPTGIQRTLLFLAKCWPAEPDFPKVWYGFKSPPSASRAGSAFDYVVVTAEIFSAAVETLFCARGSPPSRDPAGLFDELRRHAIRTIHPADIPSAFDGFLLPEITGRDDVLDTLSHCHRRLGRRCMAIVHDILPQTHPHVFSGPHQGGTSRYYLLLSQLDSIAFVSRKTKDDFESRLRRSTTPNSLFLNLGADGLGRGTSPVPPTPAFVVPATVEPRKHHDLILATFEHLWAQGKQYRLVFLGRAGWVSDALIRRFRQCAATQPFFEWNDSACDDDLRASLMNSSAAIYLSDAEGYGLPPLEALALGCPVIVTSALPSLVDLPPYGQIRLSSLSRDAVARAVELFADPVTNKAFREQIPKLRLPTWATTVRHLASWCQRTLSSRPQEACHPSGRP
jgi:glycosyltransferase involved in cell wall biosynthesis